MLKQCARLLFTLVLVFCFIHSHTADEQYANVDQQTLGLLVRHFESQSRKPIERDNYLSDVAKENPGLVNRVQRVLSLWGQKEKKWVPVFSKQYDVIPDLIKKHKLQRTCEVGMAFGTQSLKILKDTQVKEHYGVDPYTPYENDPMSTYGPNQFVWDILYHRVSQRFEPFNKSCQRWTHVRKPSVEAAQQFEDGYFDLVYLDANHHYEFVKQDLIAWWSKVRPGGFLLGDDYMTYGWPGVTRAVNEFVKKHNLDLKRKGQRIFVVRKPV